MPQPRQPGRHQNHVAAVIVQAPALVNKPLSTNQQAGPFTTEATTSSKGKHKENKPPSAVQDTQSRDATRAFTSLIMTTGVTASGTEHSPPTNDGAHAPSVPVHSRTELNSASDSNVNSLSTSSASPASASARQQRVIPAPITASILPIVAHDGMYQGGLYLPSFATQVSEHADDLESLFGPDEEDPSEPEDTRVNGGNSGESDEVEALGEAVNQPNALVDDFEDSPPAYNDARQTATVHGGPQEDNTLREPQHAPNAGYYPQVIRLEEGPANPMEVIRAALEKENYAKKAEKKGTKTKAKRGGFGSADTITTIYAPPMTLPDSHETQAIEGNQYLNLSSPVLPAPGYGQPVAIPEGPQNTMSDARALGSGNASKPKSTKKKSTKAKEQTSTSTNANANATASGSSSHSSLVAHAHPGSFSSVASTSTTQYAPSTSTATTSGIPSTQTPHAGPSTTIATNSVVPAMPATRPTKSRKRKANDIPTNAVASGSAEATTQDATRPTNRRKTVAKKSVVSTAPLTTASVATWKPKALPKGPLDEKNHVRCTWYTGNKKCGFVLENNEDAWKRHVDAKHFGPKGVSPDTIRCHCKSAFEDCGIVDCFAVITRENCGVHMLEVHGDLERAKDRVCNGNDCEEVLSPGSARTCGKKECDEEMNAKIKAHIDGLGSFRNLARKNISGGKL